MVSPRRPPYGRHHDHLPHCGKPRRQKLWKRSRRIASPTRPWCIHTRSRCLCRSHRSLSLFFVPSLASFDPSAPAEGAGSCECYPGHLRRAEQGDDSTRYCCVPVNLHGSAGNCLFLHAPMGNRVSLTTMPTVRVVDRLQAVVSHSHRWKNVFFGSTLQPRVAMGRNSLG